jgi:hypothetical protein
LDNHSKKYPEDNTLRNVAHTISSTTTSTNGFTTAREFFFQLFTLIDWKGHSCFRVRNTYRIPGSLYGIHLFGEIALGPRPPDNNERTVLSLHKYAHLIVDEQLRPLFKTAEEIKALRPVCGSSCIELILRNKERKASIRATPVIAFKCLEKGESSIITAGSSAYIQYVSYAETAFESDRYKSLLTPIDGNEDNDDKEEESLLVAEAVDIVVEQEQHDLAAAIAREDKERKNKHQAKEKTRLSLLTRLAHTPQTLDLFATKITDELLVVKKVYPDLEPSIATNLTQALKIIESAKTKLRAVKKTATELMKKSDHMVIESQNFRVNEVIEYKVRSKFKHVSFPMLALNQKNVWGSVDSDLSQTKQIAKQFTVIFNNVAHVLSELLQLTSEVVPSIPKAAWIYNCEMYWRDLLHHPNCKFGSLNNFLKFMNCCVVPITNNKDYNLFLDLEESKLREDKRLQEFHLHFWEAICKVANSYASDNNARLFIAPSYADFKYAFEVKKLESILVRKNRDAVGHGEKNEDDNNPNDKGSSHGDDDEAGDADEENHEDENEDLERSSRGDDSMEGDEKNQDEVKSNKGDDDEDKAPVVKEGSHGVGDLVDLSTDGNDEFIVMYVTGCSPSDVLRPKICERLDLTFRNILKKRNNLSCYTLCAAIDCINVIDESKGVCLTCNVSKFCTKCTTQSGVVCCQTCNYLVDESGWIKAFPSLSIIDESCWQTSMEMINNDPIFPKTISGESKAWSTLTQDEIDNYTDVSKRASAAILKIFGDEDHTLNGSTMFRIMHETCWISEDTHDAIVAIMNDSYSQYYVDQLLRDDASSSSNPPVKVYKYLNVCVR